MSARFRQSMGHCSTSFDFGEEELTYIFDTGIKSGSTVPYHKIPQRMTFREIRLWWIKYFVLFYLTFCTITVFYYLGLSDIDSMARILYFATLLCLCACFAGLRRSRPGMLSFALHPPLVILHDGHQQAILAEIMKRRASMMRQKLAWVDAGKPYYEEASKFSWLREEGIIGEQEYREARKKITALRDKMSPGTGGIT